MVVETRKRKPTAESNAGASDRKRIKASKTASQSRKVTASDRPDKTRQSAQVRNDEPDGIVHAQPVTSSDQPGAIAKPDVIDQPPHAQNFWLLKAEPESRFENGVDVKFSIDDLRAASAPEPWDGVRNHVAKNNMVAMRKGDLGFFYHSSCKVPGIAGVLTIAEEATVDESAFDHKHPYYDPKSSREKPRWYNVHVAFVSKYPELIPLKRLQEYKDGPLKDMQLLRQSRLSVGKVTKEEWEFINTLPASHDTT